MKKNTPVEQRWDWRIGPEGVVEYRIVGKNVPWTEAPEALEDVEYVEVVPSKSGHWDVVVKDGKKKQKWQQDPPRRYILEPAGWTQQSCALGRVAEACGLRKLHSPQWTMLAPNAVLHPQFGPMVTICTDGTHVVLWSRPWDGTEWVMAHRSNILGPVTTTPTAVWEWARRATPESVRKAPETKLAYAKALLEKILQQNKT